MSRPASTPKGQNHDDENQVTAKVRANSRHMSKARRRTPLAGQQAPTPPPARDVAVVKT